MPGERDLPQPLEDHIVEGRRAEIIEREDQVEERIGRQPLRDRPASPEPNSSRPSATIISSVSAPPSRIGQRRLIFSTGSRPARSGAPGNAGFDSAGVHRSLH
jgi:hypothetical protein